MEKKKSLNLNFQILLDYVLINLEKNIFKASSLEDKVYLEMSKSEIIKALSYVYQNIKNWKDSYNAKKYETIINQYGEIESIISQLELCLADYEEEFHMDGISYSFFEIGKILSNIMKRSDKDDRWQTNNKSDCTK